MRRLSVSMLGALALGLSASAAAAPGDMSVANFLTLAESLQERGALALLSSDLRELRAEVSGSSTLYRARLAADRAAGRTPHSCPPPEGSASINSDELTTHMRSYPAARRTTLTVREALFDLMRRRYPCG